MARNTPGLVPEGYTSLMDLIEGTQAALYGAWSVAPATLKTEAGPAFIDPADGAEYTNPKMTVTRAGHSIGYAWNTAMQECAKTHVGDALKAGALTAFITRPDTGEREQLHKDDWRRDCWLALDTGLCDRLSRAPEWEGLTLYVPDGDAARFLDWAATWAALFDRQDWNLVQAVAWVYTRDPEFVRTYTPGARLPDGSGIDTSDPGTDLALRSGHGESVNGLLAVMPYDKATKELAAACARGDLTATGRYRGQGKRETIPRVFWTDAPLNWRPSPEECYAGKPPAIGDREPDYWADIYFPSATMRDLWPSILPERAAPAQTREATARSPRQIPTKSRDDWAIDWFKRAKEYVQENGRYPDRDVFHKDITAAGYQMPRDSDDGTRALFRKHKPDHWPGPGQNKRGAV